MLWHDTDVLLCWGTTALLLCCAGAATLLPCYEVDLGECTLLHRVVVLLAL